MRRIYLAALLLLSLLAAGCPKYDSAYKRTVEGSHAVSVATIEAIKALDKAYDAQLVPLGDKDLYGGYLKRMTTGGKHLSSLLESLPREADWTASSREIAAKLLSEEIITPFLGLTAAISGKNIPDSVRVAIPAVRAAVLIITEVSASLDTERKVINEFGKEDIVRSYRRELRYVYA